MMHVRTMIAASRYRLHQALAFARPQQPPVVPDEIMRCLLPGTLERFRTLPAADQHHLLAVGDALRTTGAPEHCWLAGFLHDIGKAYEGHHVRTLDRGLWVTAARISPLATIIRNRQVMPRIGGGLWIAAHHATIGAMVVRDLGYPERICMLVAHHEDATMAATDAYLRQLQTADDAPWAIPAQARSESYGLPA